MKLYIMGNLWMTFRSYVVSTLIVSLKFMVLLQSVLLLSFCNFILMKRLESLTTRRKPIPTFGLPVQEMRNKFYLSEHRSIATIKTLWSLGRAW